MIIQWVRNVLLCGLSYISAFTGTVILATIYCLEQYIHEHFGNVPIRKIFLLNWVCGLTYISSYLGLIIWKVLPGGVFSRTLSGCCIRNVILLVRGLGVRSYISALTWTIYFVKRGFGNASLLDVVNGLNFIFVLTWVLPLDTNTGRQLFYYHSVNNVLKNQYFHYILQMFPAEINLSWVECVG